MMSSAAATTDSASTDDATTSNKNVISADASTNNETNNNATATASATTATIPKDATDASPSSSSKKQPRFFEILSSAAAGSVGDGGEKKDVAAAAAAAAAGSSEAKVTTETSTGTSTAQPRQQAQRRLSQSELAISAAPASVTQDRKKELLEQARSDRLQWIRHVPLPYYAHAQSSSSSMMKGATAAAGASSNSSSSSSPWSQDKHLRQLENSHAVRQCPSAVAVLSHLYGIPNHQANGEKSNESTSLGSSTTVKEIGERVANIIAKTQEEYDLNNYTNKSSSSGASLAVPTAEQRREAEMLVQATTDSSKNNKGRGDDPQDVLQAYHDFVTHLSDPVCAMLVQGMRSFCRNLTFVQEKNQVALKLQAYLDSTMESIQGHASWKQSSASDQSTVGSSGSTATIATVEGRKYIRRSLESFIYGQCHDHIYSLYWTDDAKVKEKEWLERIDSLQFVTPKHLEIAGLEDDMDCGDENNDNNTDSIRDLLQDPIHAMLSIHRYHAPFEKLQRVLAVYRGVNAALSAALNQNRDGDKSGDARRLPSADDVLPTIILTVLRARPEGLLVNLQIVEDFCLPAHLRAEAGYALTTLYGAVQFVQDFDLNEPTSHLAINADEFRAGLDKCRKSMEEKLAATKAAAAAAAAAAFSTTVAVEVTPTEVYDISVREVRSARLRGEVVDMDWAMRWQAQHGEETAASRPAVSETMSTDELLTEGLPQGFSRNYSFLSTRAEDVRMSDLPRLLSEYKMLVQATESLLAERLAKHATERKAQRMARQKELYARARELDPSLIPSSSSSNKNSTTGSGGGSSSGIPNASIDKTD